jgi:hypothetical protein
MPVTTVGPKPAIVIDDTAVYLGIDFTFPTTDALIATMDDEIYVLGASRD